MSRRWSCRARAGARSGLRRRHFVRARGAEAARVRRRQLLVVTPGIRPVDNKPVGDQKRVVTVERRFANGADHIVVGRPIRDAESPRRRPKRCRRTIAARIRGGHDGTQERSAAACALRSPCRARRSGSCARRVATCPNTARRARGRRLHEPVPQPRARLRGDDAAAAALRARRGHPVLRHPDRARRHGPRPVLRDRRRARNSSGPCGRPMRSTLLPVPDVAEDARLCLRCRVADPPRAQRRGCR